jgi:hypothetical protein
MTPEEAPKPEDRPKLWRYYRERDLTLSQVGAVVDRTHEWVRLVCLPFSDPKRRVPSHVDVVKLFEWSGGEIGPADWYPPELSAPSQPVIEGATS